MKHRDIVVPILLLLFSASLACQLGIEGSLVESTSDNLPKTNSQVETSDQAVRQPTLLNIPQEFPDSENGGVINPYTTHNSTVQPETAGVDPNALSFGGYTLFSPITSTSTYPTRSSTSHAEGRDMGTTSLLRTPFAQANRSRAQTPETSSSKSSGMLPITLAWQIKIKT